MHEVQNTLSLDYMKFRIYKVPYTEYTKFRMYMYMYMKLRLHEVEIIESLELRYSQHDSQHDP